MKKKTRIILILSAVFLCLFLPGFRSSLHVASYTVIGENISTPVRIALVTDLHSCAYGNGQRALLDAIDQQADRKSTRLNSSHTDSSRMPYH